MLFADPEVVDGLKGSLDPNEKVLWAGRPPGGIVFRQSDLFVIPFSLVWCGIVSQGVSLDSLNVVSLFDLVPLLFLVIGLYLLAGRFLHDALVRARTLYAVTEDRVIVRTGLFRPETHSFAHHTPRQLSLKESSGGRGTITFGEGMGNRYNNAAGTQPNEFFRIENADTVHRLIREQVARAGQ